MRNRFAPPDGEVPVSEEQPVTAAEAAARAPARRRRRDGLCGRRVMAEPFLFAGR
ncbi:hypothetical protein GCM10010247_30700 [Streptomyces calvus]|nr:hypothetical protein GCM10010247_30700 [Streptomyces calvus]